MLSSLKIKYIKEIYLQAGKTDSNPPLGTILGNLGVNSNKFTIDFNNFTKDLHPFFFLKVVINILENRTCSFFINGFSITFALKYLKFEKIIKTFKFDRFYENKILCIKLKDVVMLALYKFPSLTVQQSIKIMLGILKSMNIVIDLDCFIIDDKKNNNSSQSVTRLQKKKLFTTN